MKPRDIYHRALALGLRFQARGDKLLVYGESCPSEFANLLRENKVHLLALLEGQAAGLPLDQAPWLHVAKQILAGEFDGADGSIVQSLTIGLRSICNPVCRQALARIGR